MTEEPKNIYTVFFRYVNYKDGKNPQLSDFFSSEE